MLKAQGEPQAGGCHLAMHAMAPEAFQNIQVNLPPKTPKSETLVMGSGVKDKA